MQSMKKSSMLSVLLLYFLKSLFKIMDIIDELENFGLNFEIRFISTESWYINFNLDSDNSLIIENLFKCLNEDKYHNRVGHF